MGNPPSYITPDHCTVSSQDKQYGFQTRLPPVEFSTKGNNRSGLSDWSQIELVHLKVQFA